ncbi:MAG TPA: sodium-dependent transporter [Candidatus Corynebacterium gallistercoris]|uniref:Transporter n=1 Tax=Candidatus Corynebacterium gallistercoris TaxID=2838530 RepID=A0A9D1RZK2_9CORY|nr:sodium-dependent transporter [Candidatus Corynebacterium gallistercoris]
MTSSNSPAAAASAAASATSGHRETFNTRIVFLMAAIGSAVGLGNIWRFPYVAYENGGGAFLIPYLVALLTAGIPLLWFDLALGHRFRGSAPLAYRRMNRKAEPIGWIKVGVNFFIAVYYPAIIAWAGLYTWKSASKAWGDDPATYFSVDFLRADDSSIWSGNLVAPVLGVMIAVWVICIAVLATSINKGIGRVTLYFVPVLITLFGVIVIRALFLDGATEGLNAFFTPNWEVLKDTSVWISAYGQIFFSLSVGFGIMMTYASYLKPRTNLTGMGMVTAFANSSFEVLAGIGVFATLGFMAVQSGVPVTEVASGGIGLAFIAFPTIINEMPFGEVFGVLFFGCLFLAGITSFISVMEVVTSAVREKLHMSRAKAALIVGSSMSVLSTLMFSTTTGLMTLDIMDKFTNNVGIVSCAIISTLVVGWILGRRREVSQHLNAVSRVKVGPLWQTSVFALTPGVLIFFLLGELHTLINEPYGGYAADSVFVYGWLILLLILGAAVLWTFVPYPSSVCVSGLPGTDYGVPSKGRAKGVPNPLAAGAAVAQRMRQRRRPQENGGERAKKKSEANM